MKRIRVILAVAALLVAMLVATAAPAMAMVRGVDEERGESPRLQAAEENNFGFNNFVSPFFFSPFVGFNTINEPFFNNNCSFDPDDCFFNDGFENGVFQEVG